MSRPHKRHLLNLQKPLSRTQSLENLQSRNRAQVTTTDYEEEMRAMPTPLIERRNMVSTVLIRSPNVRTWSDFVPTPDFLERLYQVTDIVLIICGMVVVIAVVMSIAIGILGISRKLKGLDYYTIPFEWE